MHLLHMLGNKGLSLVTIGIVKSIFIERKENVQRNTRFIAL